MKKKDYITDFCVIGGGIAGFCAAISAARHGIKTILIHDRPVLGGNASSEIRMCICGSQGSMGRKYDIDTRETGIIEEIELENFYVNPQLNYSIWDSVLYSKAMYQENLTVLLNTSVFDAKMSGNSIESVTAWQSNSQIFHTVKAKYFADCSGDSVLASLSGAEYRYGREAKSEFNESIQGEKADNKTMGMSCIFQLRETDHYVKFTPPEWAYKYETDDDLPHKSHNFKTNFWWI
ncbi:MAG: FAD-dependent oxidoreductase, partial [Clostridia bacterium]|nr:FAD-dependent oxidoreductase [Clostridia bacterium]